MLTEELICSTHWASPLYKLIHSATYIAPLSFHCKNEEIGT